MMSSVELDDLLDRAIAFDLFERRERETSRPPAVFINDSEVHRTVQQTNRGDHDRGCPGRTPALVDADEHLRLNRRHELACEMMRDGATAEIRTWYRLEMLRLEKILKGGVT